MRNLTNPRTVLLSTLAAVVLAGGLLSHRPSPVSTAHADDGVVHLRLLSTAPAADTVLAASPAEVRLVFSEPPQMGGTTVRLVNAAEELVASTDAAADPEDAKEVFIRPESPLPAGTYTVMWRVIAQDGHTQRGEFAFRVGSPAEA